MDLRQFKTEDTSLCEQSEPMKNCGVSRPNIGTLVGTFSLARSNHLFFILSFFHSFILSFNFYGPGRARGGEGARRGRRERIVILCMCRYIFARVDFFLLQLRRDRPPPPTVGNSYRLPHKRPILLPVCPLQFPRLLHCICLLKRWCVGDRIVNNLANNEII